MTEFAGTIEARRFGAVTKAEWIAISALVISILGGAFNLGVVYADLQQTKGKLAELSTEVANQQQAQSMANARIERIDANVQFLTELAREERTRR
jgi:cell division protein FtsL